MRFSQMIFFAYLMIYSINERAICIFTRNTKIKIPSEMEVAQRYKLLTLLAMLTMLTLLTLLTLLTWRTLSTGFTLLTWG